VQPVAAPTSRIELAMVIYADSRAISNAIIRLTGSRDASFITGTVLLY